MTCTIDWNILNFSEWNAHFQKISQSTVLQSYAYARAASPIYGQKTRWGLITIDGKEAGLCQIMEAGAFANLIHAVILDRGPLWFKGFGSFDDFQAFAYEFNRIFPKRPLRRRRFIPEIESGPQVDSLMKSLKFTKKTDQGYETYWLDLKRDSDDIRAALKKKWRNTLKKGEAAGLQVRWDEQGKGFPAFLVQYERDKREKDYDGPSINVLSALASSFVADKNMLVGYAYLESKVCAAILILCHGCAATYQVGWTTGMGRKSCAHHVLLWEAVKALKDKGIEQFDLGGVHDQAKGIQIFKAGMGGTHVQLAGLYT